jgi:hypothetical protein
MYICCKGYSLFARKEFDEPAMVTHNEKNKKKNGSCEKEKKKSQPKMF